VWQQQRAVELQMRISIWVTLTEQNNPPLNAV